MGLNFQNAFYIYSISQLRTAIFQVFYSSCGEWLLTLDGITLVHMVVVRIKWDYTWKLLGWTIINIAITCFILTNKKYCHIRWASSSLYYGLFKQWPRRGSTQSQVERTQLSMTIHVASIMRNLWAPISTILVCMPFCTVALPFLPSTGGVCFSTCWIWDWPWNLLWPMGHWKMCRK